MTVEKQDSDDETELSKKRSRITIHIDVSFELYRRLSIAASDNALSLSDYAEHILEESAPDEASMAQREWRPVTRKTLEGFRKIREEIMRDRGGKPFEEDSTEMLRQQREERTRQLMGEL